VQVPQEAPLVRRTKLGARRSETVDAGLTMITLGTAWWYRDYARKQTASVGNRPPPGASS